MKMVGPTANTNSISVMARAMFSSDRFLMPLSMPATTEQVARAVITTMETICTMVLTGICGHR